MRVLHIFYRNDKTSLSPAIHDLKNGWQPRAMRERVGKGGGSGEGDVAESLRKRAERVAAGDQVFLVRRVRPRGGLQAD